MSSRSREVGSLLTSIATPKGSRTSAAPKHEKTNVMEVHMFILLWTRWAASIKSLAREACQHEVTRCGGVGRFHQ